MIRRATVCYAFVYLNHLPQMAIIIHLLTSTSYLIYLIKSKPFIDNFNTKFEIINEFFISIGAMYFILYCNDSYTEESKMDIGWFYLGFNSLSLCYTAKILLFGLLFETIPEYYQTFKNSK